MFHLSKITTADGGFLAGEAFPVSNGMKNGGFAILEVIISLAVVTIFLTAITTLTVGAEKLVAANSNTLRANFYLREAIEAARDLEVSDWSALSNPSCEIPQVCHPLISGGVWKLQAGSEVIDSKYTRSIATSPVFRNQATFPNYIVTTGGVLDPNTRKVSSSLSWNNGSAVKTISLETYVYKMQ